MNDRKPQRRSLLSSTAGLVAGLALASCLSTPAAPRYTLIEPITPASSSGVSSTVASVARADIALRLVDVRAGDGARTTLTRRDGRGRVWQDDKVRWAIAPADYVRREILAVLARTSGPEPLEHRLTIDLIHFGALDSDGGNLAEVCFFAITEGRDGRLVLAREYVATRPIADDPERRGGDYAELCQALGSAVVELAERVVADSLAESGRSDPVK